MGSSPRVLLTDRPWPDTVIEREILATIGARLVEPQDASAEALSDLAVEADAIAVCWAPLPAKLLERCRRCRIVARLGVGLDNVPVATATRLGIPVTYLPDYCVSEVADHTLALILSLLRNVPTYDRLLKSGVYDPNLFVQRRFDRLTLGLVGYGRIAQAVAIRAKAFGLNVIAATRSHALQNNDASLVPLDEVFSTADIVSLHVPFSAETCHMVNRQRLSTMKSSAFLVNTSRGGLVDEHALLAALNSGRLAGAGLDVYASEPPASNDPLMIHPSVIATPHVASRSAEALIELRMRASRQIVDALAGRAPEHVVNPEVFKGSSSP